MSYIAIFAIILVAVGIHLLTQWATQDAEWLGDGDISISNKEAKILSTIGQNSDTGGLPSHNVRPTSTPVSEVLSKKDKYDVIVIGAGIAGCVMAYNFGKRGYSVLLVERSLDKPDRIVGELLQPGGVRSLAIDLDMGDCLNGIDGIIHKGYYVRNGSEKLRLAYPRAGGVTEQGYEAERAMAFHHGSFIQKLRHKAASQANVDLFEAVVTDLAWKDEHQTEVSGAIIKVRDESGEATKYEIRTPLTVVCDGCFSKFRSVFLGSTKPVAKSKFVALELHNATPTEQGFAEVILADSPILLYQIGGNETRILADVKECDEANMSLKEYFERVVIPAMPTGYKNSVIEALKDQKLRTMPNNYLSTRPRQIPGAILVGDAFNMRHPLTGGGMSVAFNDVAVFMKVLDANVRQSAPLEAGEVSNVVTNWQLERTHNHSFVVNVLAQALYALFSAASDDLDALRQACFAYFKMGGNNLAGPVSLLSILDPNPMKLVIHFFSVAILGVRREFNKATAESPFMAPVAIFRSIRILTVAVLVIGPVALNELKQIAVNYMLAMRSQNKSTGPTTVARTAKTVPAA
eukprot:Clim_evm65s128 gene=Clim_evmTU65s128